jgi:hypothetical protein
VFRRGLNRENPLSFSPSSLVPALPVVRTFQKRRLKKLESDELAHGELGDETESLLDRFHGPRRRGFRSATLVGIGCNGSDWPGELVAGIS